MQNDKLKTLKLIAIIAVIIGLLAAVAYAVYGFGILWATFAAGITIGLLMIIIVIFLVLSIYLWIRTLLLKREVNSYKNQLEQAKMELIRCRLQLNRKDLRESEED